MDNPLQIKCHCGKVLTAGERKYNEEIRSRHRLSYQCYKCSQEEIEEIKSKHI